MTERAQEIGLLMGDEDPRLSQTALAEREAERDRLSQAAAASAIGAPIEDEEAEGEVAAVVEEEPEEEEEDLDDSAPLVSAAPARGRAPDDDILPASPLGGLRATMTDDGEIVVDEVVDEDVVPAVAEEEDDEEGYVLEEADEDFKEEAEEDEGPLAHSTDDDYYAARPTKPRKGSSTTLEPFSVSYAPDVPLSSSKGERRSRHRAAHERHDALTLRRAQGDSRLGVARSTGQRKEEPRASLPPALLGPTPGRARLALRSDARRLVAHVTS